jgi:invasion protein IalB
VGHWICRFGLLRRQFFLALISCVWATGLSFAGDATPKVPPSTGEAAAPAPQSAPGDGIVRGQHGDWQVVCKPPPPGAKNEVCALVQSVTAEDRNNVGLTIYFQKFSTGVQVLRVFAPLGVLLPPGVGLKIDDADVGHAPFHRCQSFACYAQVTVDEALLGKLKTGKTAIFIIFQTEEAGIGIPISLTGFGEATAALN